MEGTFFKNLLGTAAGTMLRLGPEHFLAKAAGGTPLVNITGGGDVETSWAGADWLAGRAVDISELKHIKARWLFRPAFLSQLLMDLQNAGGRCLLHLDGNVVESIQRDPSVQRLT